MTKIKRPGKNIVAFGSNAEGTERTTFGTTTQANDLDSNLNDSFARGWGIVAGSDLPTKQDFNAMGYTLGQLNAYLYQMGIAEYDAAQEYHQNSFTNYNGVIYKSLTNNNVANTPNTSTANWESVIDGKYLPLTGGTATGGITAPTLSATASATIGGVSVTGLSRNLYADGLQLLNTTTGFKRLTFSTGGTTTYIKLAEGTITRTEIANISLLISGTGNYANQQSSTTLLEFSARASAGLRVTHMTTTASGQPTYGYVTKTSGAVELWAKLPAFQSTFSVTELSSNHVSKTVSMVSSISSTSTEPENIVYIEPILQITTANVGSYTSETVLLYPGGSESSPPTLTSNQGITISNPFNTMNIICYVEIYNNDVWGRVHDTFYNFDGSVTIGYGIFITPISNNNISITTGADQLFISGLSRWTSNSLSSAKYRVRVIKVGV